MKLVFVLLLLCVGVVLAERVRYESHGSAEGMETVELGSRDQVIEFRVLLKMRNTDLLDKVFDQVTDPKSPRYQEYWTRQEVEDAFWPDRVAVEEVIRFVRLAGAEVTADKSLWIDVRASVAQIESMFDSAVSKTADGRFLFLDGYSLPAEIAKHVQLVQKLGVLVVPSRDLHIKRLPEDATTLTTMVVPQTLETIYAIPHTLIQNPNNTAAPVEFSDDHSYSPEDLTTFFKDTNLPQPQPVTHMGPFNPDPADGESSLDIDWILAIATNVKGMFIVMDNWILEYLQHVAASNNPPLISTISWSANERQEGASYNGAADKLFQSQGLRGLSFVAASGDNGASDGSCNTGNGLNPGYPAASAFVTTAGATALNSTVPFAAGEAPPICARSRFPCSASGTETVAEFDSSVPGRGFVTGGGFSVFNARPSYQSSVVSAYLNDASIKKPPTNDFNSNGRGFPDIGAMGYDLYVELNGEAALIGGTSASTPIFGGILARVNELLFSNGKKPIGFANPVIYQMAADMPATFTPVGDLGDNDNDGCRFGYGANPHGWDPLTGLGVPNVTAILSYMNSNLAMFKDAE